MPNIVGYTDCAYIKGQYYRYAASPKPVVYTGNINTISEDLLVKTMLVTRGNVSGTLPNDTCNTFLISTVKYGTDVYLQTAYLVQENFNCYEYKRIYNGGWTDWIGVESSIDDVRNSMSGFSDSIRAINNDLTGLNRSVSSLNSGYTTLVNSTLPGISSTANNAASTASTLNAKMALTDISSDYTVTRTGGDSKWSFSSVEALKAGNIIDIQMTFHMSSSSSSNSWSAGTNLFKGTLASKTGKLPIHSARLFSYYGSTILICNIDPNGEITLRVLAGTLSIGNRSDDIKPNGLFMIGG